MNMKAIELRLSLDITTFSHDSLIDEKSDKHAKDLAVRQMRGREIPNLENNLSHSLPPYHGWKE